MTKVNLGHDTSGRPLVLDDTTLAKVRWAEKQLGFTFALIQGSYRDGAGELKKSGNTHDRAGAVDLRSWDIPKRLPMTRVLTVLREAGLVCWHRWQSAFPDHEIHCLDYGNPGLSPSAAAQVVMWQQGSNGLSGSLHARDDGPSVTIPKAVPGGTPKEPTMPTGLPIHGVDLSHHNTVTLAGIATAKASGVRWVYHKTTEGNGFTDSGYTTRRNMCAATSMPFGAYHFARPGAGENGAQEAKFFLSVANYRPGDMPPMLDLEDRGGLSQAALTAWVGQFVAQVKAVTGVTPIIYTPFDLNDSFGCPLWVARYSNSNAAPNIPKPWTHADVRQFSNGVFGRPNFVPGLGNIDLNTIPAGSTFDQPAPAPATDWFDMATAKDLSKIVDDRIAAATPAVVAAVQAAPMGTHNGKPVTFGTRVRWTDERTQRLEDKLDALTAAVKALVTPGK